jgi:hypothetical protein
MSRIRLWPPVIGAAAAALAMGLVPVSPALATTHQPRPISAPHAADGFAGRQASKPAASSPNTVLCTSKPSLAANVLANCNEPQSPHNETAVVINPLNPLNIVVGANDYQQPGPVDANRTLLSRAHVSRDGGHSWSDVALPYPSVCTFTGDPTLAFDAAGTVYYGSLCEDTSSVVITTSTNGGLTWSPMVLVATGTATLGNDHPVLAAWGRGNVVVTWIPYSYTDSNQTQITTVPMVAAVSHDGGQHFGATQVVSGSSPQCVGLSSPSACDQTWGNAVAVGRNGSLTATFYNTSQYAPDGSTNLARTKHFAVQLDPATGGLKAGPFYIGQAYDGINEGDFPVNVNGRQTLHDSELRLLMQGNIAADPTNPRHVAVVWFDDRNASAPVPANPYGAATNSDVIVSQSYDGGVTWSTPAAIQQPGDQFFPWAAYDALGRLQVGFMDRSYDPANHQYGYTLASEVRPGSLQFGFRQLSTALSDPTRDNRWSTTTADPAFPKASRFIGDYSGIATWGLTVVAAWTDQRLQSDTFSISGHGEDTFVAVTHS